jgi:hypothetical protein
VSILFYSLPLYFVLHFEALLCLCMGMAHRVFYDIRDTPFALVGIDAMG